MVLQNILLSRLPPNELGELTPLLHRKWLSADTRLVSIEERLDYIFFPESAIVSVITGGSNGRNCYVGLYGFDGFGSVGAALHIPTSPAEEIVQSAGYMHQIRTRDLHSLLDVLPELRRGLHNYLHIFMMQISYTAFANASTRVEQRLARLLLMFQDRTQTSSLAITHQRLSDLLGARRAGVTEAIHVLEANRLIRSQRGLINILDRPRLITLTAGSYGAPEAEYLRLV